MYKLNSQNEQTEPIDDREMIHINVNHIKFDNNLLLYLSKNHQNYR